MRNKHILSLPALIAVLAAASSVSAEPCAVLQYEEMKDMSVEELSGAYCNNIHTKHKNARESIDILMSRGGDMTAAEVLKSDSARCSNEGDRIIRVLVSKGATPPVAPENWYSRLCKTTASKTQ
jgi:hypothetical protein